MHLVYLAAGLFLHTKKSLSLNGVWLSMLLPKCRTTSSTRAELLNCNIFFSPPAPAQSEGLSSVWTVFASSL